MPMLEPDFSEVGAIEPGTYAAKIVACDAKTSQKGSQMVVPEFEVNVNGKMRKRTAYLVIAGAGAYGFLNLLKATGFGGEAERMSGGERVSFDTDSLIGQECNVVVEEEIYNGEKRDKIASFLPL